MKAVAQPMCKLLHVDKVLLRFAQRFSVAMRAEPEEFSPIAGSTPANCIAYFGGTCLPKGKGYEGLLESRLLPAAALIAAFSP